MLKLTVAVGDKILIGNDIIIDVQTCSNKQTRLGINAPIEIPITTIFKDSTKQFKNRKNREAERA